MRLLALCLACVVAASSAADLHLKLGLVPGSLTVAAPQLELHAGQPKTVTLVVRDARGSGAGWTLALTGARGARISRAIARCASGSTCTLPRLRLVGRAALVAGRGSGMGRIRLDLQIVAGGAARGRFTLSR